MSRRILIVDDVATNRIILKVKLTAACYVPLLAADGAEALVLARQEPPDLVLLDYAMPDMDGIAVCRALRADPATAEVPIIMFTASGDDSARIAALQAGADDFLTKPIDDAVLMARIRNLLRTRDRMGDRVALDGFGFADAAEGFERPARIALIAGRAETAMRWRKVLEPHLRTPVTILSREAALEAPGPCPDLYILAHDLDGAGSGLHLMSDLRSRPESRDAAICVVLSQDSPATAATALDLGADDVLRDGFDGAETALRANTLVLRKRRADRLRDRLSEGLRLALTDPLTGLRNRRFAVPALDRMLAAATAAGDGCAVMALDLDRFKTVNDRFGHGAGDAVLAEVGRRLAAPLRDGDLIARIGGEEFLVAARGLTDDGARALADRLRQSVSGRPVLVSGVDGGLHVTVSIGLTVSGGSTEGAQAMMTRADQALLAAKAEGRDQVRVIGRSAA
jgi:two-component system, cell cycle response regulator